ncbi:hypothetical protein [Desulfitobacterium sp.]|uniref:hypothetical protein n=1 Tax=Desulfitobacterium sp. TaxID=49981 RepID=UPI002CEF0E4C|nr:hypothetical protein [Desulfitobacterium sp.]HVJ49227.1 hypothetical protein [Desulfitobacterium sp.]
MVLEKAGDRMPPSYKIDQVYRVQIISRDNKSIAHFATKPDTIAFLLDSLTKNPEKVESQKTSGIDHDEINFILNDTNYFYELSEYLNENE